VPITPVPATPAPTPVPPPALGRAVQPNELTALADRGTINEQLLLAGVFRISTSTPPVFGRPASAVMRPADPALASQIRVIARLQGNNVPAEGSNLTLTSDSHYYITEVRRGADGQINVNVEQRP
jgi:hypothetical protein